MKLSMVVDSSLFKAVAHREAGLAATDDDHGAVIVASRAECAAGLQLVVHKLSEAASLLPGERRLELDHWPDD